MKTKILITTALLLIVMIFGGCVSQGEYNSLQNDKTALENDLAQSQAYSENLTQLINQANDTIIDLSDKLNQPKEIRYFPNRTAIEYWLDTTPDLGISADAEKWYQYALYYQKKALDSGYIVSSAYVLKDEGITIWCEVVAEDGWVYYFDPDTKELKDTYFRIDMAEAKILENKYVGTH
jgi:hypothetical protein